MAEVDIRLPAEDLLHSLLNQGICDDTDYVKDRESQVECGDNIEALKENESGQEDDIDATVQDKKLDDAVVESTAIEDERTKSFRQHFISFIRQQMQEIVVLTDDSISQVTESLIKVLELLSNDKSSQEKRLLLASVNDILSNLSHLVSDLDDTRVYALNQSLVHDNQDNNTGKTMHKALFELTRRSNEVLALNQQVFSLVRQANDSQKDIVMCHKLLLNMMTSLQFGDNVRQHMMAIIALLPVLTDVLDQRYSVDQALVYCQENIGLSSVKKKFTEAMRTFL